MPQCEQVNFFLYQSLKILTPLVNEFSPFRVCYIFGKAVKDQVSDVTPTYLTGNVLSTIRQVDDVAYQVSIIYWFCNL